MQWWPFRKKEEMPPEQPKADCPHTGGLTPHWSSVADMGHNDRASSYLCKACGAPLSKEQGQALLQQQQQ